MEGVIEDVREQTQSRPKEEESQSDAPLLGLKTDRTAVIQEGGERVGRGGIGKSGVKRKAVEPAHRGKTCGVVRGKMSQQIGELRDEAGFVSSLTFNTFQGYCNCGTVCRSGTVQEVS